MKRLIVCLILLMSMFLLASPLVFAAIQPDCCDGCVHTIKIVPVGSVETGEPIITKSPANLIIYLTGQGPIKNVWLLIVLNKPTYDNLDEITINGQTFMTKTDFTSVGSAHKIPPSAANHATGYPGSLCQYEVAAIRDKLDEPTDPIYYGLKFFLQQITTTPTSFTLAVKQNAPGDLKALVLALGRLDSHHDHFDIDCCPPCTPFNACTAYTNSTLVVPELSTIALFTAPFGAFGFFGLKIVKQRKRAKRF